MGERKFVQTILFTSPRWPYVVKPLKCFFFRIKWPRSVKHGVQHWTLKYYEVCSSDDPRLTFDLFTQMSTLIPYAFVLENA